jgi:predicted SprT family Zn-dependent metalloprotease
VKSPTEESYSAFQEAYDFFNRRLFAGDLPSCLITFQRQKRTMGYVSVERWINANHEYKDELAINPEYFANYPLVEICQTLVHEMVHIWQAHFGSPGRRGYHNLEWANKMIAVGLMPTTTGQPGGDIVGETVLDYILHDGPFMEAFSELEKSGFKVAWMDRYPVIRQQTTTVSYTRMGTPVELNSPPPAAMTTLPSAESDHRNNSGFPYSFEQLEAAFNTAFASQLQPASQSVPTTKPQSSQNKHKYRCPQCQLQVWGKPKLFIKCGECETTLVEYPS